MAEVHGLRATTAGSVPAVAPKLQAEGVGKVFTGRGRDPVTAVGSIDLAAGPGEFVSILGPSGCGKSTFLYIAGGFVEASHGTVRYDGAPVEGPGPERGIVFQEFALFPWKTVLGNVTYGLARQGMGRAERNERARHQLEMVNLGGVEKLYPKELSGGMKQRVAIARTLATDPDVLLMDEPFGALDAQTRAVLQIELMSIWERTRKTVLFVTHSVEEAIYLSDRIYVFSHRPSRIKAVIDVELGRPRDRERMLADPAYPVLHRRIWELLREDGSDDDAP
ncbi:ABC transporter ATP-binding protein [Nonomuraea basaltis]|uniref:ABC transporter ATP-binding protein n=1 Tax=Nonomuraea basaltis TaxID=2495887 RepID=UPI00110C5B4F|nr:ABC transporter ATP-binding protein [Nonomuraea basaltis]TMR97777.1 ABC transporter ATP-binding protein [Nonomuraea basaltis]